MTVKTITNAAIIQHSTQVVKAFSKARAGRPGKVIAIKSFKCVDVLVIADTPSTKTLLVQDTKWTSDIAGSLQVQGYRCTVMAQAVKVRRPDHIEHAKLISNVES